MLWDVSVQKGRDLAEEGFIIVAVLWILLALASFAAVYALYASNGAVAARVSTDRMEKDALMSAALELTALRLFGASDDDPRLAGEFRFPLAGAEAAAAFRSEGARIDLNAASKETLTGLFATLGAKPDDAALYASRIIGWRKKNDKKAVGSTQADEAEAYKDAGIGYLPRQSPFQNVAELRFVMDLPADVVNRALPFVTVFNGRKEIDPRVAPLEVLESLPHATADLAQATIEKRAGLDAKALMAMLSAVQDSVTLDRGKAYRVALAMRLASGRKVAGEAVILLSEKEDEPYRVLAWRDDFDGAF